jgi:hypothetical protein
MRQMQVADGGRHDENVAGALERSEDQAAHDRG